MAAWQVRPVRPLTAFSISVSLFRFLILLTRFFLARGVTCISVRFFPSTKLSSINWELLSMLLWCTLQWETRKTPSDLLWFTVIVMCSLPSVCSIFNGLEYIGVWRVAGSLLTRQLFLQRQDLRNMSLITPAFVTCSKIFTCSTCSKCEGQMLFSAKQPHPTKLKG